MLVPEHNYGQLCTWRSPHQYCYSKPITASLECKPLLSYFPKHNICVTIHQTSARSILAHRLRCWSNINTIMIGCSVIVDTHFTGRCRLILYIMLSMHETYVAPMLNQWWSTVYGTGPALTQHWVDISLGTQQARDVDPVLVECWDSVCDAGPTFSQHRVNVSCLLRKGVRFPAGRRGMGGGGIQKTTP